MNLAVHRQGNETVVSIDGPRLDAAAAPGFKAEIKEMIDGGERRIVVDLGAVQFMDSSGLGALVGCLKYMGANGDLRILSPSPAVMKVLKLTRMDRVIKIVVEPFGN